MCQPKYFPKFNFQSGHFSRRESLERSRERMRVRKKNRIIKGQFIWFSLLSPHVPIPNCLQMKEFSPTSFFSLSSENSSRQLLKFFLSISRWMVAFCIAPLFDSINSQAAWLRQIYSKIDVFLSALTTWLVFQPFISVLTSFMIRTWQPIGLSK